MKTQSSEAISAMAEAIELTLKVSEARDSVRAIFGDRYEETIIPLANILADVSQGSGESPFEIVTKMQGRVADEQLMLYLAAAAECVEARNG